MTRPCPSDALFGMSQKKILLTGGTGFIGTRLVRQILIRGDRVTIVTRKHTERRGKGAVDYVGWDHDPSGYDAVVHLAGEPILGKRWTDEQKKKILDSRVDTTRKLVEGMGAAEEKPKVFVCGSAIGYYGSRGDEPLPETAAPGSDFMAGVCVAWEEAAARAKLEHGIRTVSVRTGVVLGQEDGMLGTILPIFKLGAGGTIGMGKQWMSWIHVDDLCRLMLFAIDEESVEGPLNGTAPNPVTNKEFTKTLGRVIKRPTLFPVPPLALKVALGGVAEVMTGSQRCETPIADAAGFEYRYRDVDSALRELLLA